MNPNPLLDPVLRETITDHLQELLESASLASSPTTTGTAGGWHVLLTFLRRHFRNPAAAVQQRHVGRECHVRAPRARRWRPACRHP